MLQAKCVVFEIGMNQERNGRVMKHKGMGPVSAPLPGRRYKRKPKTRTAYFEQINTNVIAAFKSSPSYRADTFKVPRPLMGQCCTCLPMSKKDLIMDTTYEEGMRNILDVKNELRRPGVLSTLFPYTAYSLGQTGLQKYPDISFAVLANKRVVEAVQQTVLDASCNGSVSSKNYHPLNLKPANIRAKRMLQKMKASISTSLIRFTGWFLLNFLSQFLRTIQVHKGQLEMVQKAAQRGVPVIYLPLHRSHLDYILVTFILWNYNIRAPYVAAGNNLDIPFFNLLMRGLGGFFIRRKLDTQAGKKDLIYRALLQTYMQELLKKGEPFEFFIEGGRTRSGKALIPKGGLLSVVVDSCIEGVIPDAYIVPLSISYEKLLDGNFTKEQMGLPKVGESFFGAVKGILRVLLGRFGSVRVDFAQPFSVKEYIQCNPSQLVRPLSPVASTGDMSPESSYPCLTNGMSSSSSRSSVQFEGSESSRCLVKNMAFHIIYTAVNSTALMCTNILAFLLLTKHREGASLKEIAKSFSWLRTELKMKKRDVGFCGETVDIVDYAHHVLGKNLVSKKLASGSDGDDRLEPILTLPCVFELSYYGNTVLSAFLLESVVASAIISVGEIDLASFIAASESEETLISRDKILSAAEEFCKLLQHEFVFVPPCAKLSDVLSDTVEQFISFEILANEEDQVDTLYNSYNNDRQWTSRLSATLSWADEDEDEDNSYTEEPLLKVNLGQTQCRDRLQFFCQVLAPILESYLVTAYQISHKLDAEMPEADFIQQLGCHAKERVANNLSTYSESAAMDTLKNAVKAFEDLRIVECFHAGNLRMIVLSDQYQVRERLEYYTDKLESVRE